MWNWLVPAALVAGTVVVHRLLHRLGVISGDLADINVRDEYAQIVRRRDPTQVDQLVGNINVSLDMLERERRFASTVAHEIRSPLAGIRVTVEEALSHPGEPGRRPLHDVLRGVDRLEALANDLLLIARSRFVQVQWERLDLCELVRQEVADRADPIPVSVACVPGVPVEVIRTQMCEVLTNLLDNAQRHARHHVHVEVGRKGRVARLTVSDDGPGVPEEERERIFERLVRLKGPPGQDDAGAGLGLAITREIVKAHHGAVWVQTSGSGGACFVVELPLAGFTRRVT
ncbi:HAMP domain-containing sensor histidine kinase [Microbispora sp. NPDC046973]|uniref:sensor histidine kinase n=1 Tax=Microbispora sp. NPDC046973 TaxID=3155022 RepID=UPI0033C0CAEC